jgi:hypothetical protein
MLKPIARSDFKHAVRLLGEGFPERSQEFWEAGLSRFEQSGTNDEAQVPFGFFLMEKSEPVGVALTPASLRQDEDGAVRRVINMSSWYVRPEHRWRAPMMLRGMVADPDSIYTDLTPTAEVQKMLPVFGFKPMNVGILIRPLASLALNSPGSVHVRSLSPSEPYEAAGPSRKLIEIHRQWRCEPVLLEQAGKSSLVIWRRTRVRGIPTAEIVYAESVRVLEHALGALARHLLMQGKLFLVSEARDPAQSTSRYFRARGIWFAKNDTYDDRIDSLGSELCILGL